MKERIIDIGDVTIDLEKVVKVSNSYGNRSHLYYQISFTNNTYFEVYEKDMSRKTFVQLWKDYYK